MSTASRVRGRGARMVLAMVPLSMAAVPAMAKEKSERAQIALPVIVEADAKAGTHSFRVSEFCGVQPIRYRSAVTPAEPVAVPEVGAGAGIVAGERLVELQATSRAFTGSLYCKSQIRRGKIPPALLCLADRDGDGAMDQLWGAVAASGQFVVPYPEIRSLRTITPVRVAQVTDLASLAFQIGFYVSGTNPLLGQHHFYAAIGAEGKIGHLLFDAHRSISLERETETVAIGGVEISVKRPVNGAYEDDVFRGFPRGERMVVSPYPKTTIYVSVPG